MNPDLLAGLVRRFATLEDDLNRLDAATGDGDHGTTILKGLRAAAAAPETPGLAFRNAAGGASGTIFSYVIDALAGPLPEALTGAVTRITQIGGAKTGDKTMLDALIPASHAADIGQAVQAARAGAEATRAMEARRGRARHVEGKGAGHLDPGAVSVAEILEFYSATLDPQP